MSLAPCPSCARHVRRTETSCPFCAASITLPPAPTRRMPERLGRAALVTFGAAALATSASACGNAVPAYGAPAPDTGTAQADAATPAADAAIENDAGEPMTLYGGPIFDDAGDFDAGTSNADYGAPPPP
ncbi:MAG: hypothetical protein U0234_29250 [Sandaracinus sp.]